MAIKKATTTDDVNDDKGSDGENKLPLTAEERLAEVESQSTPEILADVEKPKTVKVKSPAGFTTEVPEDIKQALLDSGYTA